MVRCCSVLLCLLTLLGCVSTGSVGIITKSGANPAEVLGTPRPYKEVGQASARACRYFALAIVPWGDSALSTAVDEALQVSGADALLNATVSSSLYGFIPYYNVFAFTCSAVKGTAIRFEALPQQVAP